MPKRSHGPAETTQGKNLPNRSGPPLGGNYSDRCAKSCRLATFSATGAAFLSRPTLHSEWHLVFCWHLDGLKKLTCLEPVKIPGRYQATIMPCMSTIVHGVETVALFSGGYFSFKDASFAIDAAVPGFEGLLGSFSA